MILRNGEVPRCPNAKYFYGHCNNIHFVKQFIPCRKYDSCEVCRKQRYNEVFSKAMTRWESIRKKPRILKLWTFGTNLDDTEVNRRIIVEWWKIFREEVRNYTGVRKKRLKVQIWALEAGTLAKKLHIHCLVFGYSYQPVMRKIWASVTGIDNPNVNYAQQRKRTQDPEQAVKYIVKYVAKEGAKYYWGDQFLTEYNNPIKTPYVCWCGSYWEKSIFHIVLPLDAYIVHYLSLDDTHCTQYLN